MAVTSKPLIKKANLNNESQQLDDNSVKKLINRGGEPPKSENISLELKKVQLRLPQGVLDEIDGLLSRRNPLTRPSRHTWLLEAIAEKLEKDKL